jgi:hypothetical protein
MEAFDSVLKEADSLKSSAVKAHKEAAGILTFELFRMMDCFSLRTFMANGLCD